MRNLDIKINRAAITGFDVRLSEDGLPNVSVNIVLMTEQGKEVTTHQLRTNGWREEDKFALPLVMIDPIQRIAAALEEVVVNHLRDGQLALGGGDRIEIEGEENEFEIVDFGIVEEVEQVEGELDEVSDEELVGALDLLEDEDLEAAIDSIEDERPRLISLDLEDIGRYVEYIPQVGEPERGRIKSYDNHTHTAWVVYKCDDDWDNYGEYTAAATNYSDLAYE